MFFHLHSLTAALKCFYSFYGKKSEWECHIKCQLYVSKYYWFINMFTESERKEKYNVYVIPTSLPQLLLIDRIIKSNWVMMTTSIIIIISSDGSSFSNSSFFSSCLFPPSSFSLSINIFTKVVCRKHSCGKLLLPLSQVRTHFTYDRW